MFEAATAAAGFFATGCAQISRLDQYSVSDEQTLPPPSCGTIGIPIGLDCKDVGIPPSACLAGSDYKGGCERPTFSPPVDCTRPESEPDAYVDGTRTDAQDGSLERPWHTIQQAIDGGGQIILVEPGPYPEAVSIGRRVRIFTDCDRATDILSECVVSATLLNQTAVSIRGRSADGSELHGLVISGLRGVHVAQAEGVLLDRIRVRATDGEGIRLEAAGGARVEGVEIASAGGAGLVALSSRDVVVEDIAVVDTRAIGYRGHGIELSSSSAATLRTALQRHEPETGTSHPRAAFNETADGSKSTAQST